MYLTSSCSRSFLLHIFKWSTSSVSSGRVGSVTWAGGGGLVARAGSGGWGMVAGGWDPVAEGWVSVVGGGGLVAGVQQINSSRVENYT